MKREYYAQCKENARNEAIRWQNSFAWNSYSYYDILEKSEHLRKLGKRYGLLREFKENGIC